MAYFFSTVPTVVMLFFTNLSARSRFVKKLSHVTFLPLPLKSSVNVRTVLAPMATLFSVTRRGSVCSRPSYGAPRTGNSSRCRTPRRPYLSGLLGIYCMKGHLPRNGTKCSS
ncbi:hypothetical protein RRG08_043264 [Elysia crispata]|uniref:Uncharacterized protein n=1 Tax=Elysia crispata TaxID=231223 RepID=A0AAE0XXN7_9GAST|nr:hypothetical protein RRG08_043264 [Elysia crispata]